MPATEQLVVADAAHATAQQPLAYDDDNNDEPPLCSGADAPYAAFKTAITSLTHIKVGCKVYIHHDCIHDIEPYSFYYQPVKRCLYNMVYGGADRVSLLRFLFGLCHTTSKHLTHITTALDNLYVRNNYKMYKTITTDHQNMLDLLLFMQHTLPLCVDSLRCLCVTYNDADDMKTQLRIISNKFLALVVYIDGYINEWHR